jgi:plasmid maintenance system antidote protein VapI
VVPAAQRSTTICSVRFRDAVQIEFEERRRSNPRFSLRGFARRLEVHHATLSRTLRGGRPLAAQTVRRLGRRLGMPADRVETFVDGERAVALIRAVRLPTFRADSRWLASVSGIPLDDVNITLHALPRDGRVQMVSRSQWLVRGEEKA